MGCGKFFAAAPRSPRCHETQISSCRFAGGTHNSGCPVKAQVGVHPINGEPVYDCYQFRSNAEGPNRGVIYVTERPTSTNAAANAYGQHADGAENQPMALSIGVCTHAGEGEHRPRRLAERDLVIGCAVDAANITRHDAPDGFSDATWVGAVWATMPLLALHRRASGSGAIGEAHESRRVRR